MKRRRQLLSFVGGVVELTEDVVSEASLLCIAMFMRVYRSTGIHWEPVDVSAEAASMLPLGAAAHVANQCWNSPSLMAIKIVAHVAAEPSKIAAVLDDAGSRPSWDVLCVADNVVMPLETNDPARTAYLLRLEMQFSKAPGAPKVDFSLMHTSAINQATGGYVHASRSVLHDKVPESAHSGSVRGVALPSGWHVAAPSAGSSSGSEITYVATFERAALDAILGGASISAVVQGFYASISKLGAVAEKPAEGVQSRYNERILAMGRM